LIRHLIHADIDKSKWDECIKHSPNGLVYAYSWYLDIACPGWEALVEDDYTSILPLPMGKKYGYTYSYPPLFTQQLGVFSKQELSEEKVNEFISAIPSHYRYIEMHLNEQNIFHSRTFETRELITYTLDLNRPYAEIAASYSTQTKRNLKKALSSSLTIVQTPRPEKIIKLFRDNRGLQHELPFAFYTVLERLTEALLSKGVITPIGVNDKNNAMCAGAFFVKNKDRHIFLFSGANQNAYNSQAMTLLLNSYIEEHAEKPITFDFEGSMDKDLARFYSGFGSTKRTFLMIRKNTLPAPVKWIKEIQYKRKSAT